MKGLQLAGAELDAHLVDLLDTDAVFARDCAADFHAEFENRRAISFRPVILVVVGGVEHDQRVQVAVAGMENVRALELEFLRQFGNALQNVRKLFLRNGAVHAVVVGHDAAHRGERRLAAGPELQALGFVPGRADLGRACLAHDLGHAFDFSRNLFYRTIRFAQQDCLGIKRIACVHELLDGGRGFFVHHFEAGRDDAGTDDVGYCLSGLEEVVEGGEHDLGFLRFRQQLDRDLCDDAKHAFRAGHQREQVITRGIEAFAADLQHFALDGDDPQPEDVMHGEAVLQAVHTAGILGDIAAN